MCHFRFSLFLLAATCCLHVQAQHPSRAESLQTIKQLAPVVSQLQQDGYSLSPFVNGVAPCRSSVLPKTILLTKLGELIPLDDGIIAGSFDDGSLHAYKDHLEGILDSHGQVIVPIRFSEVRSFSDGLAAVKQNGRWGFVNTTGDVVIPCQYESVSDCKDGQVIAKWNGKWGRIDREGRVLVENKYLSASGADTDHRFFSFNTVEGINIRHSDLVNDKFTVSLYDADNHQVATGLVLDVSKNEYIEDFFTEGYVRVCRNGKLGYYDKQLHEAIACQYDDANDFSEGLALVGNKLDDDHWQYGYIDQSGRVVIPFRFEWESRGFTDGLALVKLGNRWGYVDRYGQNTFDY